MCHVPLPAYVHTVLDPSLATRQHRRARLVTLWHICMYPPGEDSGSPVHLLPVSECRDGRKAVNACTLAVSRHCHTAVWPHPLTNLQYFSTTTGVCGQALLAAMLCPSDATRWRRQACSHTLHTCRVPARVPCWCRTICSHTSPVYCHMVAWACVLICLLYHSASLCQPGHACLKSPVCLSTEPGTSVWRYRHTCLHNCRMRHLHSVLHT